SGSGGAIRAISAPPLILWGRFNPSLLVYLDLDSDGVTFGLSVLLVPPNRVYAP
ncbi:hypothetical protein L195_g045284, partial [Trifolium pratense]